MKSLISFIKFLQLCLLYFNWHTDGQKNYRIDAHWSNESSKKDIRLLSEIAARNRLFYLYTFMPFVI